MANQNYDQTLELALQGNLNWGVDSISALLYTGAEFDPVAKTLADLTGEIRATQVISGRYITEDGMAMGLPVAYQRVSEGEEFQIVIVQETGNGNPNLLAFIDTNADDSPISVAHSGTLIIRPMLVEGIDDPPTIGVWLRLSA